MRPVLIPLLSLPLFGLAFAGPQVPHRAAVATSKVLSDYAVGWRPNPAFVPVRARAQTVATVQQLGEVVVLEGDDDLVSSTMSGGFGVDVTLDAPLAISKRFYTKYGDEFDELIVFTTFNDEGNAGASAYEISAQNDAKGIGRVVYDRSSSWGATNKKLFAFVNMMKWDQFGNAEQIKAANSYLFSVLGQEFAHRWLSFMHYVDSNGVSSLAMLGRDQAHWASTLQAYGSVMDGNLFHDDGDGWYSLMGSNFTYSPLDLYGMGLLGKADVPPFFLLHDAVTPTGKKVNPEQAIFNVKKIQGTREDITIEQVVAAEGERIPAVGQSQTAFRVAWVLLTRPGERADSPYVVEAATALEQARKVWEWRFGQMTGGRGTMCTQVSAPCGAATARIEGGAVVESGGNHNHVAEPGEAVFVHFNVHNDSGAEAIKVAVRALGDVVGGKSESDLSSLAPASTTDVTFYGTIPDGAACGEPLTIEAEAVVDGHTFRGFQRYTPGLVGLYSESFESSPGPFAVNREGGQNAANGWEYGTPLTYGSRGYTIQPGSGHASQKAWFTGLAQGTRGQTDSSLGLGSSTLTSLPFDVSKTYKPVLRYWLWYQAIDYSNPQQGGMLATDTPFFVEGSADGGKSWVILDQPTESDEQWRERVIELEGLLPLDKNLVVRFRATRNPSDTRQLVVEAGIDDLSITTLTEACNPNAPAPDSTIKPVGHGCALGATGSLPGTGWLALLPLMLLALFTRRRAR